MRRLNWQATEPERPAPHAPQLGASSQYQFVTHAVQSATAMPDPITINLDEDADRFARFKLIGWWDQQKLRNARVIVVGAGALGNEIIKNLALLGVGNILICDKDRIEHSNLSRSILYRACDAGKQKALVAAEAARAIYPECNVHAFDGDIVHDLGLGVFRWADVVLGGLDNRLARLTINRNCYRVGKPWIDGAIEQIQGIARVFTPPEGACYECTMSQRDWQVLQNRRSCNLLSRTEMEGGKTPTTPTISSIIAGLQCQEALKLIHGLPTLAGKGWMFDGLSSEAFQTEYQRKHDCLSHDTIDRVIEIEGSSHEILVGDVLAIAQRETGQADVCLELTRDVLEKLVCPKCSREEAMLTSLGKVKSDRAACQHCEGVERHVVTFNRIDARSPYLGRTLAQLGLPAMDILVARGPGETIGIACIADAPAILGGLWEGGLEFE
ncbi:MAG TPA: ThiF family adenylyltransferase [Tepidisphaeraceae bacterium]|nr:ThiF family adenylyltransferase [Tepidisphaeraceae bacterium]